MTIKISVTVSRMEPSDSSKSYDSSLDLVSDLIEEIIPDKLEMYHRILKVPKVFT